MTGTVGFGALVAVVAAAVLLAVFSHRLSEWLRVPAPALFLVGAAVCTTFVPTLGAVPLGVDEELVTVALIFILFDGGMHIGWRRFRSAAVAVTWLGVVGTIVTAGGLALAAHGLFGFGWESSLLIGAALAPTDPAVVFSVLGRREITGRSGVILEGESGANDPVGIALMIALLGATGSSSTGSAVVDGLVEFARQLLVGALVGVAGGWGLARLMRRPLPNEALYPIRVLAAAGLIFGVTTVLSGSGFLAVLLAGIMVGDVRAPLKSEIERVSSSLAGLAEIVAFTVLGLTVSVPEVLDPGELWVAVGLAALLIGVVRPVLVGILLLPLRLRWGERGFVLWAGLKGAVPILLGIFIVDAGVAGADRLYGIVFVVVLISVLVQGGLAPLVARRCRVPMRTLVPKPWTLGIGLRSEPEGLHRYVVAVGSAAEGTTIAALHLDRSAWISLVTREGSLVQIRGTTRLRAGDEVVALADADVDLAQIFRAPPAEPHRRDGPHRPPE
ncbi:potassium/proton antiporter [Nakamurella sp.]|uniref:potassium/proton antiporter n=1 Tax=Nakamurella sp. TaxID=1869182 RepID=UPI00378477A2